MIKLQGLLGQTFGGYITIRGTAKFSDIVNHSEAKEYQRETIQKHLQEISSYYEGRENLFFPEVILSLELKYNFDTPDAQSGVNPIQDIVGGKSFKSNVDAVDIQPLAKRHKNDLLKVINIFLNSDEKVFGRIDGNHRLTATNTTNIYNEEIPFCVVLFDSENIQKQEKMLFFNINSKAIPLTTEESLKSIFEDEVNFPNELLKNNSSFGWEYYFAKQIKRDELNSYFHNLHNLFNNNFLTTFLKLFKLLFEHKVLEREDGEIDKIRSALTEINTNIYSNEQLKNSSNSAVFIAFMFYQLKSPELISFLKSWILKNEIFNIEELEPESIINIMSNIANHKVKKIFVAMPYYDHSKVTEYNKLFKEALTEVERSINLPFKLELIPIMRNRGESERIDQRLLNQIRSCDIFIADLTGKNENVLYETAFAEGVGIPSLLIKKENDIDESGNEITLPFDMDKRQYVPFQESSYYSSIKSIVKTNLPSILEKGTWYESV
jgi:nucleoside 2-deoxyribosyltransferase